jgi:hypothetical protein
VYLWRSPDILSGAGRLRSRDKTSIASRRSKFAAREKIFSPENGRVGFDFGSNGSRGARPIF